MKNKLPSNRDQKGHRSHDETVHLVLNKNRSRQFLMNFSSMVDRGGLMVGWFDKICAASDDPRE